MGAQPVAQVSNTGCQLSSWQALCLKLLSRRAPWAGPSQPLNPFLFPCAAEVPVKRLKDSPRYILDEQDMEMLRELELERNTELEIELGFFGRKGDLKAKEEGAAAKWKDTPKVLHDSKKERFTVFISNLSYKMTDPEVKLRALFASCGEVAEVRSIYSNKGAFRGYCYVEFKDEKSALQAFELDRTVVEGRPMFVSPYVDKSKNPDFKVPLLPLPMGVWGGRGRVSQSEAPAPEVGGSSEPERLCRVTSVVRLSLCA